ncbi:MAG TPA: hypothetical protein VIG50_00505 [Vicinamibacteria bacterium]|jgi:hypothetical protein
MHRPLAALAVLAALAAPAIAEDHLVSSRTAEQRLLAAESGRARNLAAVDSFVASGEGAAALATLGVDASAVRGTLSTLSDAELQELASRAAALQGDPVAGAIDRQVIYIGAIAVAAIILIILIA